MVYYLTSRTIYSVAASSCGVLIPLMMCSEGDAVFLEATSFHSASPVCQGRPSRYVLTSAVYDERTLDLPHKLYQTQFSAAFISALPKCLRPTVDWPRPLSSVTKK